MKITFETTITCHLCGIGMATLIDPPDDIETFPGIPRWVCGFCHHFWIPNDKEISALGLRVPTAKERGKWRNE